MFNNTKASTPKIQLSKALGTQPVTKTKGFKFPFAVADTEAGPSILWDNFNLNLEFTTYQGQKCKIVFSEVSHFELLCEDELEPNLFSYDGVVEVVNSETIQKLVSIGEISRGEASEFTHLVIGFNEKSSYLSVIFKSMEASSA